MDISEETALLPAVDAQQDAPNDTTPLPKLQLAVLCATRLMDPLTFTQVSPINASQSPKILTSPPDIPVHQPAPLFAQHRLRRVANRVLQRPRRTSILQLRRFLQPLSRNQALPSFSYLSCTSGLELPVSRI